MKTYSIKQICEDVADQLRGFVLDIPMVRQAINDHADALDKAGHKVNFNFSQDRAVKRVFKSLSHRR
jgi:hypothetical protein